MTQKQRYFKDDAKTKDFVEDLAKSLISDYGTTREAPPISQPHAGERQKITNIFQQT